MNFFGFHVCMDEVMLFMMGLPFIGIFWRRFVCAAARVHERIFKTNPKHTHEHGHVHGRPPCSPSSHDSSTPTESGAGNESSST